MIQSNRRCVNGKTTATKQHTTNKTKNTQKKRNEPVMFECCIRSHPAATAASRLSTEEECACAVKPARCTSSTIASCTRGEKIREVVGSPQRCSLEAYLMISTPLPIYVRTSDATCAGSIQVRAGQTFSELRLFMRSAM